MKTLASSILENMKAEGLIKEEVKPVAESAPMEEPAPQGEPSGEEPVVPTEDDKIKPAVECMLDPDKMSEALDMMCDQADRFMDESDAMTFTATDDAHKQEIVEARSLMRNAAAKMRGKKKQ